MPFATATGLAIALPANEFLIGSAGLPHRDEDTLDSQSVKHDTPKT